MNDSSIAHFSQYCKQTFHLQARAWRLKKFRKKPESDVGGVVILGGKPGFAEAELPLTEYEGPKTQPPDWWKEFSIRREQNTGITCRDTMLLRRKLLGPDRSPRDKAELARAIEKWKRK